MSVNCIHCAINDRTGTDLLCDSCRQHEREKQVRCPACNTLIDEMEDLQEHVTYWGSHDSGPVDHECPSCSLEFYVYEIVQRTYHVGRTAKEASEWWKS